MAPAHINCLPIIKGISKCVFRLKYKDVNILHIIFMPTCALLDENVLYCFDNAWACNLFFLKKVVWNPLPSEKKMQ